jgi:hypothetical protein
MQTRITIAKWFDNKWFDAQEGFGPIRLDTLTAILSIFAIVAAVTIAIAGFADIQTSVVG